MKLFGKNGGEDEEVTVLVTPHLADNGDEEESDGDDDDDEALFTRANLPTLLCFFWFVFASAAFMSIITPFLPLELADCGANSAIVGVIFAAYPLANLASVPVATRFCSILGRSRAFVAGATLEALFGILFGYIHKVAPLGALKWLYLAIRFAQGMGSSIAYTALIAWVSDKYRPRLATVLGFQEAVGGIGYMLGPSLGGLLYQLRGITLPMLLFSISVLISLPALHLSMVQTERQQATPAGEKAEEEGSLEGAEGEGVSARQLVNVSTVNSTFVTLIAAVGFGFISPVAAPHFQEVLSADISTGKVGLLLAIPALLYAVCSPLSGILSESQLGFKRVMFAGMVLLFICYLLMGPIQYLAALVHLRNHSKAMWADQILSLVLLGIGAAFAFVPALPDMQKSLSHLGPDATNAMAGYFNGIYCLGEALGPMLAGLQEFLPFSQVASIIAYAHLAYMAAFLIACVHNKARKRQFCVSIYETASPLQDPLLYNT